MISHYMLIGVFLAVLPISIGWTLIKTLEKLSERKQIRKWDKFWKKRWEDEHQYPFVYFIREVRLKLKAATRIRRLVGFYIAIFFLAGVALVVDHVYYIPFLSNNQVLAMAWLLLIVLFAYFIPAYVYYEMEKHVYKEMIYQINGILHRERYEEVERIKAEYELKKAREAQGFLEPMEPEPLAPPVPASVQAEAPKPEEPPQILPLLDEETPPPPSNTILEKVRDMGPDATAHAIKAFLSQDAKA